MVWGCQYVSATVGVGTSRGSNNSTNCVEEAADAGRFAHSVIMGGGTVDGL